MLITLIESPKAYDVRGRAKDSAANEETPIEITFCGTRGYIEEASPLHRMHSACLIAYRGRRLLLDAGETWDGHIDDFGADWIAITHAHPDHAFGLRSGTAAPVYGTSVTCEALERFPLPRLRAVAPDTPFRLGPFRVTAYPVVHSIRAPAVGFRVSAGRATIVYNPDIISIVDPDSVLHDVDAYIGDGASLTRPIVRRHGTSLFGHTTIRAQLKWCRAFGIPRAFIVHCGKQLVEMEPREVQRQVDLLAGDTIEAVVTYDGMRVRIAGRRRAYAVK